MPETPRRQRRRNRAASIGGATNAPRAAVAAGGGQQFQVRTDENIARQTGHMLNEMKRVLGVSALCFGMLAVLVVIDRLQ
jgi:hypothetical protein